MKDQILGPGAIEWLGVHYRTILTTASTGGAISITESVSPPGSGPPRHVHHDADETFIVMSGDVEFWLDGERSARGPGQALFVPRTTPHTFRVTGELPGRHLVILTPGGFEGFFVEMAARQLRIPEDMAEIARVAETFSLTFTGPPLGAEPEETFR